MLATLASKRPLFDVLFYRWTPISDFPVDPLQPLGVRMIFHSDAFSGRQVRNFSKNNTTSCA